MMKKKQLRYKKLSEKIPGLKKKRGAKVMYKLVARRPRRPIGIGAGRPKNKTVKI